MRGLPYNEIVFLLLDCIHSALSYCVEEHSQGRLLREDDAVLTKIFSPILSEHKKYPGKNKHLIKGLSKTEQARFRVYPRLSKLVIKSFNDAQDTKNKSTNYKGYVLPSPLGILYQALTVPSEPQTAAYAFVVCRSILFAGLELHPKHPDINDESEDFYQFSESQVLRSILSFRNHIRIQARWPDKRYKRESVHARIHFLTGHLLSLKGYSFLWFESAKAATLFCGQKCADVNQVSDLYLNPKSIHFRLSASYEDLPDGSEIINWVFGLPIPIRGADILFYGALKRTVSTGLVISLHGQPGVGKTTVALSLAAALSPFNTTTVYLSLEEACDDLENRLHTIIPNYLQELTIYPIDNSGSLGEQEDTLSWFNPHKMDSNLSVQELTVFLKLLSDDLFEKRLRGHKTSDERKISGPIFPAVCPLLIVIDNVNELFADHRVDRKQHQQLEGFIDQCRAMGAIVVLIAAEDIPDRVNLDYLVDVSLRLKQKGVNDSNEKPVRLVQLLKTRHQISRQGSHVFHVSSSDGFRISPQVPSQLDKREKLKKLLPSKSGYIQTLNIIRKHNSAEFQNYLPMRMHSHVLIHGYGSAGKAGFGLKLLLSPTVEGRSVDIGSDRIKISGISKNKVLIVSFLYPVEYYDKLFKTIKKQLATIYSPYDPNSAHMKVQYFYPGYLTPEDFVYKIVRLLDEANLEGEPYTGIMLDGLHNVLLQFESLQNAGMIWPLLYNILSRYKLTVVTTFTNFSTQERLSIRSVKHPRGSSGFQSQDDSVLMLQGQKPFLHALVKAADYYFVLEEVNDPEDDYKRKYWLSVKASDENPPTDLLQWDRQKIIFDKVINSDRVYGDTSELFG